MTRAILAKLHGTPALFAVLIIASAMCLDGGPLDPTRPNATVDEIEYIHRADAPFDGHGLVKFGFDLRRAPMSEPVTVLAWNERIELANVEGSDLNGATPDRGDLRVTRTDPNGRFRFEDLDSGQRWRTLALWRGSATVGLETRPIVPGVACEHLLAAVQVQAVRFVDADGRPQPFDRSVGGIGGIGSRRPDYGGGSEPFFADIELAWSEELAFVVQHFDVPELARPPAHMLTQFRQVLRMEAVEEDEVDNLGPQFRWNRLVEEPGDDLCAPAPWRRIDRARVDGRIGDVIEVERLGYDGALRLLVPAEMTSLVALGYDVVLEFNACRRTCDWRWRYGSDFVIDLADLARHEEIAGRELTITGLPTGRFRLELRSRHRAYGQSLDGYDDWLTTEPDIVDLEAGSDPRVTLGLSFVPATVHLEVPASLTPFVERTVVRLNNYEDSRSFSAVLDHRHHTLHGVPPGRWTVFIDDWGREKLVNYPFRRTWLEVPGHERGAAVARSYLDAPASIEDAVWQQWSDTIIGDPSELLEPFTIDVEPGAELRFRIGCER